MRVDAGYSYANTFTSKPTESASGADFSKVMQEAKGTNKTEQVATVDQASEPASSAPNFKSMTVAEYRGWLGNELEQGNISPDEVFPFMALGIVVPNSDANAYDFSLNVEKRNFILSAQESIKNINDSKGKEQFQTALDMMERSQGHKSISETV